MIYRKTYLESRTTLADSGEKTVDVNVRDPITALWVEFRATNGSTNNQANTLAQNVDSIEVIDGSDVLFSLDGPEAFAYTAYWLKQIPYELITELPSTVQDCSVIIPFGRFIGDVQYALDPTRFTNLQVRVKWNLANVNAVGATGFGTGTAALTILAIVMEGAQSPNRLLMTKEFYTSTGAASGVDYLDLPVDYPYRSLLLRAYKAATAPYSVISHLKLNCDGGKLIPFDMRMTDLIRLYSMKQGVFSYKHQFHAADGDTLYMVLKCDEIVSFTQGSQADTVIQYTNNGYGQGAIQLDTAGVAQASDVTIDALVQGFCPYGCVYLPFGLEDDPNDWFPVQSFASARLELTQGAASSTIAVCLQQDRPY